ncbi:MAG: formate/nitrite transporter family protein [Butyricicoccaceae bacterium]
MIQAPKDILTSVMAGGERKTALPVPKMLVSGILAGAFIAFGAQAANMVAHSTESAGLAKMLAGCIFPVGLMLVVLLGMELFTGNCLFSMGLLNGTLRPSGVAKNLIIVYIANMIGAALVAALVFGSGQLDTGTLGAYTIKVAMGKVSIAPLRAVCSGILCNLLVCLAVLMAGAAKDAVGKIFAIFFPILAFVTGGFEHCVANGFYVPAGIFAASNPDYTAKACELYGYTAEQIASLGFGAAVPSFVFVTIGNILGGALIGAAFWYLNREKK